MSYESATAQEHPRRLTYDSHGRLERFIPEATRGKALIANHQYLYAYASDTSLRPVTIQTPSKGLFHLLWDDIGGLRQVQVPLERDEVKGNGPAHTFRLVTSLGMTRFFYRLWRNRPNLKLDFNPQVRLLTNTNGAHSS